MGSELIEMNSLIRESSAPGAAGTESFKTETNGQSLLDRLTDAATEIPESQMMDLLDGYPHDETVHAAIIARRHLSDAVIVRLIGLVSPSLFDRLVACHPLPEKYRREIRKRRPGRPSWWTQGLLNIR